MHLAPWLMDFAPGGADFLRGGCFGRLVGGQRGSMRAPDGSGEAPAGGPGGSKIVFFFFNCFYCVFTFSMSLALMFMFWVRVGAGVLPKVAL